MAALSASHRRASCGDDLGVEVEVVAIVVVVVVVVMALLLVVLLIIMLALEATPSLVLVGLFLVYWKWLEIIIDLSYHMTCGIG